jgi:D-alanyl-D-alanine carboxypeptidase
MFYIVGSVAVLVLLVVAALALRRYGPEEAAVRLQRALRRAVGSDSGVRGAVMAVDAPRLGLARAWAHGVADVAAGVPMTVETPFLAASVGKLAVAAAVAKLAGDGRLSLDDGLGRWAPPDVIAGLPVEGGDEALARVTVRQLLSHRSGLPDYFSGRARDGSPRVYDLLASEPERAWTRAELFAYARAHYAPAGRPGEAFHYSDLNYDLLGVVLEAVAGKPFHEVVRETVLAPLGLAHTWYHAFEPAPPGLAPLADVHLGEVRLRGARSLSADQAGGGLATTVGDLCALMRGLLSGVPVPLDALATSFTRDAMHRGIDVGLGVWRIRPRGIFFALAGLPDLIGHSGSTGVWSYIVAAPGSALDGAVLTGAVSQSRWEERHVRFLLADVLPILVRTRAAAP